jgi:hypothetical protein
MFSVAAATMWTIHPSDLWLAARKRKTLRTWYTPASGSFRLAVGLDLDHLVLVSWRRLAASTRGRDRNGNTMHAWLTFVWPKPIDRDTLDFCSLMHVCILDLTPKPIFEVPPRLFYAGLLLRTIIILKKERVCVVIFSAWLWYICAYIYFKFIYRC